MKPVFTFFFLLFFCHDLTASYYPAPPHPDIYPEYYNTSAYPKSPALKLSPKKQASPAPFLGKSPVTGTHRILLIPFSFSDKPHAGISQTLLSSFRSYYEQVSHGRFSVEFISTPAVTSSHTYSYYGSDSQGIDTGSDHEIYELIREALNLLKQRNYDFTASDLDQNSDGFIDHLMVIHAGNAQENGSSGDIWSHMWKIINGIDDDSSATNDPADGVEVSPGLKALNYTLFANSSPLGIMAHEFGHDLGLVDLYSTNYTSNGVGNWDLMCLGCWNGPTYTGESPAWPCAYNRYYLGWADVTDISTQNGVFTLPPAQSSEDRVYRISISSTEYFLLENRSRSGYDSWLPISETTGAQTGMLIWHIDENVLSENWSVNTINNNRYHKGIDLEEADGGGLDTRTDRGNSGDPYPGSAKNTAFTTRSNPSSASYYSSSRSAVSIEGVFKSGENISFTKSSSFSYTVNVLKHPVTKSFPLFISIIPSSLPDDGSLLITAQTSSASLPLTSFYLGNGLFTATCETEITGLSISSTVSGTIRSTEVNITPDSSSVIFMSPAGGSL